MRMTKALLAAVVALAALLAAAAQGGAQKPKQKPTPTPTPKPVAIQVVPIPSRNEPPTVKLVPSADRVTIGCDLAPPDAQLCKGTDPKVTLSARATDPDGDTLHYTYTFPVGRPTGAGGPEVTVDLTGVRPGVYTFKVEADDGNGSIAYGSAEVTVDYCPCDPAPTPPCPNVNVDCPSEPSRPGQPVTFTASVSGGDPGVTPTYSWTVSAGTIQSGQGTSSISVDTTGLPYNPSVTATVEVGGYDRACSTLTSDSCSSGGCGLVLPRKIDEYAKIPPGDEKARLHNFAVELQNDPTTEGHLVCYGGRVGPAGESRSLCERARDYLVNTRGIYSKRLTVVDGGFREKSTTELWLVWPGGNTPLAMPTVDPSDVKTLPPPRPRGRRRRARR